MGSGAGVVFASRDPSKLDVAVSSAVRAFLINTTIHSMSVDEDDHAIISHKNEV